MFWLCFVLYFSSLSPPQAIPGHPELNSFSVSPQSSSWCDFVCFCIKYKFIILEKEYFSMYIMPCYDQMSFMSHKDIVFLLFHFPSSFHTRITGCSIFASNTCARTDSSHPIPNNDISVELQSTIRTMWPSLPKS